MTPFSTALIVKIMKPTIFICQLHLQPAATTSARSLKFCIYFQLYLWHIFVERKKMSLGRTSLKNCCSEKCLLDYFVKIEEYWWKIWPWPIISTKSLQEEWLQSPCRNRRLTSSHFQWPFKGFSQHWKSGIHHSSLTTKIRTKTSRRIKTKTSTGFPMTTFFSARR